MQYFILSKEQAKALVAEVEALAEEAFQAGVKVGRGDVAQLSDEQEADAYDAGYDDGKAQGYDEGYNDGAADSYDDGYEDGQAEAELRAAETAAFGAAFDEPPRIHEWTEGTRLLNDDGSWIEEMHGIR
jgi:flagellar biosynthesis/type III secretory pathway protein FliH